MYTENHEKKAHATKKTRTLLKPSKSPNESVFWGSENEMAVGMGELESPNKNKMEVRE